jgi:hypothetical protein
VEDSEQEEEQVLAYRRRLEWREASGSRSLAEGLAVRQIMRLNLRELLGRLDEPRHRLPVFDGAADRFTLADVPKVYHLNVVARLDTGASKPLLHRTRVVLDKERIIRLEMTQHA